MSIIIQGFPGIGKTTLAAQADMGYIARDIDSGPYITQSSWPFNYLDAIASQANVYEITLCSVHEEIVKGLRLSDRIPPIWTVFPSIEMKDEMMDRYRARKDVRPFMEFMEANYDTWIGNLTCEAFSVEYNKTIRLQPGQYLSDVLGKIT